MTLEEAYVRKAVKKEIISEAKKKGLEKFIAYFMAKYPNYALENLRIEKLNTEYLEYYSMEFLASYVRYSELSLLDSGIRDENVREKLIFMHQHIGTIKPTYKKFIWNDLITLEDLKRWLPLFSHYDLKERILRSTSITEHFKALVEDCMKPDSYTLQNIKRLHQIYSNVHFEIEELPSLEGEESLHKLLTIQNNSSEKVSFDNFMKRFRKVRLFLKSLSLEELTQNQSLIQIYFRDPSPYAPMISSIEELENFSGERAERHMELLYNEFDIEKLKDFFTRLFLGISLEEFNAIFPLLPKSEDKKYQLLEELYKARFPLALKNGLYERFSYYRDLRPFIEKAISITNVVQNLNFKDSVTTIKKGEEFVLLRGKKFSFLTVPMEEYMHVKDRDLIRANVQTNERFDYSENEMLLAFPCHNVVSYDEESHTCLFRKSNQQPSCIVNFDNPTLQALTLNKAKSLPIVTICTREYATRNFGQMEEAFAEHNWDRYLQIKQNLAISLKKHPWLYQRFFNSSILYNDVAEWMNLLEKWTKEGISGNFLKQQLQVLNNLLTLDENLEKEEQNLKEGTIESPASQYRKNMVQYLQQ